MMHDDQLPIDADVAGSLLREQFPEWRDELVEPARSSGTVNAIFRVGEHLSARFRLQSGDPALVLDELRDEAAALDELSSWCPVPVPQVVTLGSPGEAYPLPWSILRWLPGETATPDGLADSTGFADDLIALVRALRSADTRGRAFSGTGRGDTLAHHDAWVETCLARSDDLLDVAGVRALWQRLRILPPPAELAMTHGDLIPGNLLVDGQRLIGVLDGGGFGPADPALDLVAGWHLLGADRRRVFRERLARDPDEWQRGAGWALEQALGVAWYYHESNPEMSALGRNTLRRLLTDPDL